VTRRLALKIRCVWLIGGEHVRIVEGTFEPLYRRRHKGVLVNDHEVTGKGTGPFASHGVSLHVSVWVKLFDRLTNLVGHSGTAVSGCLRKGKHGLPSNLVLLEWLLDLLEVGKQTDCNQH
jgi:hypothetical protein